MLLKRIIFSWTKSSLHCMTFSWNMLTKFRREFSSWKNERAYTLEKKEAKALTEAYNWRIYSFLSESYRSIFEISSICLEYNYHVSYLSYVYSAADQKFTCKSNKKIGELNSIVGYVLYFTFTYKRSDSVWKSNLRVPEIDYIFF